MLPTLVLTALSAVTDPVEVHACQPTHWFSRLLCCSTMRVRLEMTPQYCKALSISQDHPQVFVNQQVKTQAVRIPLMPQGVEHWASHGNEQLRAE